MQFIIRWLATAVAVGAAVWWFRHRRAGHHRKLDRRGHHRPGAVAHRHEHQTAVAAAQPAHHVPTFGNFYLVVNTAMLYLAAWLNNGMFNEGFYISSFGSAFFASIVISIVSAIMTPSSRTTRRRRHRVRRATMRPTRPQQLPCCPDRRPSKRNPLLPEQARKPTTLHAPAANRTRRNAARGSPSSTNGRQSVLGEIIDAKSC